MSKRACYWLRRTLNNEKGRICSEIRGITTVSLMPGRLLDDMTDRHGTRNTTSGTDVRKCESTNADVDESFTINATKACTTSKHLSAYVTGKNILAAVAE